MINWPLFERLCETDAQFCKVANQMANAAAILITVTLGQVSRPEREP